MGTLVTLIKLNEVHKPHKYLDETGKILEMLVMLSFTMLARSVNTMISFEWQEKNASKEKKRGFFF